jgi:hypothetical protein
MLAVVERDSIGLLVVVSSQLMAVTCSLSVEERSEERGGGEICASDDVGHGDAKKTKTNVPSLTAYSVLASSPLTVAVWLVTSASLGKTNDTSVNPITLPPAEAVTLYMPTHCNGVEVDSSKVMIMRSLRCEVRRVGPGT